MYEDEGPSAADIERFGDATRRCPECGRDVYDEADICPHCGHAFSNAPGQPRAWMIVTVIIMIVAFLLFLVI